jgi:AmmeMemoRadiSam system protein B
MRTPIANKTHYISNPQDLDKEIQELFLHQKGPGALPIIKTTMLPLQALLVPHGSYKIAGPCMAWAYNALAEQHVQEPLYILIGSPQQSMQTGTTLETFSLSLGEVRPDQEFIKALVEKKNISINTQLHQEENVIEVQLPILQYVHGQEKKSIKIVPLLINQTTNISELAIDIKETLVEQNKQAVFIIINNFIPYGREFKYVPYTEDVTTNLFQANNKLFETIKQFNKEEFLKEINDLMAPISGKTAIEILFSLIKPEKISLEQTYCSGDITGDYKNMVTYASFVIGKL